MTAMPWAVLWEELACWRAEGRVATLWWRDDDAETAGPALDRLLTLTGEAQVPLALAVVPARADPDLGARVGETAHVRVLQHGYAHINHAPPDAKKCELGGERSRATLVAELSWGRARLSALFGAQAMPVLVPPWNRIDSDVFQQLGRLGYAGVSTFGPRPPDVSWAGPVIVNAHVDPIDWRGSRGFVGEWSALAALAGHLRARRRGEVDATEPTGLLTHHLDHDAAGWAFLARLADATHGHPAVSWLDAGAVFTRVRL